MPATTEANTPATIETVKKMFMIAARATREENLKLLSEINQLKEEENRLMKEDIRALRMRAEMRAIA